MKNKQKVINRPGYDALWLWFGLSRASFLTIPRVLMHEMSDKWQGKMAILLDEYYETYKNLPDVGSRVSVVKRGKFIKIPDWMLNYRHPDYKTIKQLKG